ncbi:hypothetical protein GALMADRAFT_232554 [Galerina marginata CBS 339.88]|uniref:Cyclin N-terminal domain-containing protein n=1 Tax=Galerina marginata (strain CBS 339.88) TaxID=685588 RepID=A0A067SFK8_GALM3|nr:hypothetical protein GALMADRAFT_232554 [Galerina marginata CBS 339.88]
MAMTPKLSLPRFKIAMSLISLNSSPHSISVGLSDIQACLHATINSFSSIIRIKNDTIDVLDHLGDIIPMPTLFCSTWETFNHVVKGYCRNRIGQSYIERGNYQILRSNGDQVTHHADFTRMVEEGETVEMSIIVQPSVEHDERRCPKCHRLNTRVVPDGSWIHCITRGCDKSFRCTRRVRGTKTSQKRVVANGEPYPRRPADCRFFRRVTLRVEYDEYAAEVKRNLHKMERLTMPSREKLDQQMQHDVELRKDLIDLVVLIHESLDLRAETLYLAVNILDRYLSLRAEPVPLAEVKVLAGTSLWLAAKKEDVFVPTLYNIIAACSLSLRYEIASHVIQMESKILHTLHWMLEHPTAFLWFSMSIRDLWGKTEVKHVGWFLMELTLYYPEFVQYRSSSIAAGALIVARTVLDPAYHRHGERREPLEVAAVLETFLGTHFNDLPVRLVEKYSRLPYSNVSRLVMIYYSQATQTFIR